MTKSTSENHPIPPTRLHYHNHGPSKGWTSRYRPWKMIYQEQFETRREALKREKQLKSARGRRWIWEELVGRSSV